MPIDKHDLEGFQKPSFLPDDILSARLAWNVVSMENLPENIKQEFPAGFVIKQYRDMYSDGALLLEPWSDPAQAAQNLWLFGEAKYKKKFQREPTDEELEKYLCDSYDAAFLSDILHMNPGESPRGRIAMLRNILKPEAIASQLIKDQELLIDLFRAHLPNFVERMDFVFGQPDPAGPRYLYGIQKQIKGYCSFGRDLPKTLDELESEESQQLAEQIKDNLSSRLSLDALSSLVDQLSVFVKKVRELRDDRKKILDIWGPDNILVTADGTLKLIDIDILRSTRTSAGERDKRGYLIHDASPTAHLRKLEKALTFFDSLIAELKA